MNADVIIPLCACNHPTLYVSLVAIRTCQASTKARILVMCNNTPPDYRKIIEENCRLLGVQFHYVNGPFSISKTWNIGTAMTTGEFIAYASADVIYFPNWFENIVDLWREHPEYWLLTNYSFDWRNIGGCCKTNVKEERKIVDIWNPCSGLNVMKRSNGYLWDEQFPLWELDADLLYHLERNKLKAGVCMNARADHMIDGIRNHIDYAKHFGTDTKEFFTAPRRLLEIKWGLVPQK